MIPNKQKFMELSKRGLLGNTLQSWNSYSDLLAVNHHGLVTIRNKQRDSPFFVPSVNVVDVGAKIQKLVKAGAKPGSLYFQELPHLPGCRRSDCQGCGRLMNGEVMRDERFITLTYGTSATLNLRHDLERNGIVVDGLKAVTTIQTLAGAECYEALQVIWQEHPTSIIEFTAFKMPVGMLSQPWVIWEVRDY